MCGHSNMSLFCWLQFLIPFLTSDFPTFAAVGGSCVANLNQNAGSDTAEQDDNLDSLLRVSCLQLEHSFFSLQIVPAFDTRPCIGELHKTTIQIAHVNNTLVDTWWMLELAYASIRACLFVLGCAKIYGYQIQP